MQDCWVQSAIWVRALCESLNISWNNPDNHPWVHWCPSGSTGDSLEVWRELDLEKVEQDLRGVLSRGITSLAVLLLHSYTSVVLCVLVLCFGLIGSKASSLLVVVVIMYLSGGTTDELHLYFGSAQPSPCVSASLSDGPIMRKQWVLWHVAWVSPRYRCPARSCPWCGQCLGATPSAPMPTSHPKFVSI